MERKRKIKNKNKREDKVKRKKRENICETDKRGDQCQKGGGKTKKQRSEE